MTSKGLQLKPINPVEASSKMGQITFGAIDMSNQGFDYVPGGGRHNLSTPAMIKTLRNAGSHSPLTYKWMEERMKDLVYWSIYYTACAMIYILNKVNWNEREESWLYREDVFFTKTHTNSIVGTNTRTVEQVAFWMREAYKKAYGTNGLSLNLKFVSGSMLTFAPMLVVATISIGIILKTNIFEKNKYS